MNIKLLFPWIAQVIFFLGILPQILLNFKIKSIKGLSDFLLIGYFNAYIFYLFYVYCFNLPLAYKVMIPLSFLAVLILIFQRFYYVETKDFYLRAFYSINLIVALIFIPVALENKFIFGNIAGWFMMVIWAIYQIPQIIKNHKMKSVKGLSFAWLGIIAFGDFTEFVVAIFLGLPIQTYCNNFRGIFIFFIFLYQFFKFRN